MSGYKDRLKNAQRSGGSDAPQLKVRYNFEVKVNPTKNNKPSFSFWEKPEGVELKEQKFSSTPIEGIFIGSAMKMSAYSDDLGARGGKFFTSIYFKNSDSISLMEPGRDGKSKVIFKGTSPEVKAFMLNEKHVQAKVARCLYILTKGGLVKVETNMIISIDQLRKIEKELTDKKILLVPSEFDMEDKAISKDAKDRLGKFAGTNKPKYAAIVLGNDITDDEAEEWNLIPTLDEFEAWKKYKETTHAVTATEHSDPEVEKVAGRDGNRNPYLNNGKDLPDNSKPVFESEPVEDDLPF